MEMSWLFEKSLENEMKACKYPKEKKKENKKERRYSVFKEDSEANMEGRDRKELPGAYL